MNLAIDFGNTSAKAGLFDHDKLIEVIHDFDLAQLESLLLKENPAHLIVSTVNGNNDVVSNIGVDSILLLEHNTPLPFRIDYKTPETLGIDRIAAVAGAQEFFPDENCLVIDIGTCITFDFINSESTYIGGAISPGVDIRFKALNTFTANLPLVDREENVPLVGQTTVSCIRSGVINGIVAEINEIIRMYHDKYTHLRIILCGGGTHYFENKVKEDIFAAPELVLRGLNRILLYNV